MHKTGFNTIRTDFNHIATAGFVGGAGVEYTLPYLGKAVTLVAGKVATLGVNLNISLAAAPFTNGLVAGGTLGATLLIHSLFTAYAKNLLANSSTVAKWGTLAIVDLTALFASAAVTAAAAGVTVQTALALSIAALLAYKAAEFVAKNLAPAKAETLPSDFTTQYAKIGTLETRVKTLETNVGTDIQLLQTEVGKKADQTSIDGLTTRIGKLETDSAEFVKASSAEFVKTGEFKLQLTDIREAAKKIETSLKALITAEETARKSEDTHLSNGKVNQLEFAALKTAVEKLSKTMEEKLASLQPQKDNTNTNVDGINPDEFNQLKESLNQIKESFNQLKVDLNEHKTYVGVLSEDLKQLTNPNNNNNQDNLTTASGESDKSDHEENVKSQIAALVERLTTLENSTRTKLTRQRSNSEDSLQQNPTATSTPITATPIEQSLSNPQSTPTSPHIKRGRKSNSFKEKDTKESSGNILTNLFGGKNKNSKRSSTNLDTDTVQNLLQGQEQVTSTTATETPQQT